VHRAQSMTMPLATAHEHGVLILSGDCTLEGQPLDSGSLYYLGTQRSELTLASRGGARILLIGGLPFPETILMWWNFVARTPDEIRDARADWEAHRRFGDVSAYKGARIPAPEIVRLAQPNLIS
jgi:redox-sensitive bicupin YhaK (pirin superfamily)